MRALEDEVKGLKISQDEVNKALDLQESEIINHATQAFTTQKDEMDKELILNNLQFRDGADWKQCKKTVTDMLISIGVHSQFSIYAVNVNIHHKI